MKFQLAALASVALLPQASAFAPAALSVSKFKSSGSEGVRSAAIDDEEYLDNEGGIDAWSKLVKMRDFDPDDEDDEELVSELLDATAAVLEIEEVDDKDSSSVFRSALSLVRLLRKQVEKKKSLDFTTYSNHPEVSFSPCFSVFMITYHVSFHQSEYAHVMYTYSSIVPRCRSIRCNEDDGRCPSCQSDIFTEEDCTNCSSTSKIFFRIEKCRR